IPLPSAPRHATLPDGPLLSSQTTRRARRCNVTTTVPTLPARSCSKSVDDAVPLRSTPLSPPRSSSAVARDIHSRLQHALLAHAPTPASSVTLIPAASRASNAPLLPTAG